MNTQTPLKAPSATDALLRRFQTLLAQVLLCWMAATGHAAQPRIVFHEIVNPGPGKLVHNLGAYPAMSGNGNVVVYSVNRADSQLDLFAINTDGTGQHSLGLFPHNAYRPAISHNGVLAALWNNSNLYTLNTTSGTPVNVLTMNTPGVISSIAVNDNGTKVYFTLSADDYIFSTLTLLQAGVWEMNPDGSGRRLVTGLNAIRSTLGLSVTGYERVGVEGGLAVSFNNRIVFPFMSNYFTGMHHIMSVNADGTGLRAIGPQAYSPSSVTISRDGSKVAFDQYSPRDLNTVNWDGTGHVVQVVPAHAYDPLRLTENGSHIALVDRLLRSDGGGFRSLRSGTSGSILAAGSDAPYLQVSADGRKICSVKNFGNTSTLVMIELDPDNLLGAPDITHTAMTPSFVVHNNGTQATVTAQATYSGTPNSAFVDANLFLNGLPDPIFYSPVGTLFDDGTNGDAVAGNGLFTQNQFNFGYPASEFGPRVVRFVTENTVSGLRHATMVDHQPFFVLASAPAGSAPAISNVTPNPGTAGGTITINGSNFGITRTGNVVTFNGYSGYVASANGAGTQLIVEVPGWFADGDYAVVVSANGQGSTPFAWHLGAPPTNPDIDLGQTTLAFGNVTTGTTSDQSVFMSNTGTGDLVISAASSNNARFAHVVPALPLTIPAGQFSQLFIRFTPLTAGAQSGTLTITSNDPDEGSLQVSLSGTGTTPSNPDIDVTQTTLGFGSVATGTTSDQSVFVSNTGTGDLVISAVSSNNTRFAHVVPALPLTIPAGQFSQLFIRFSPLTAGAQSGTLTITSNDPDEGSVQVSLSGTGTGAALPELTTMAATGFNGTSPTLNGTVNANGTSVTVSFEYGLTTAYGSSVSAVPGTVTGASPTAVGAAVSGLAPNTVYHFRVVGLVGAVTYHGGDVTFATGSSTGTTQFINFDNFTMGVQAANFLAAYGIPSVTSSGSGPGVGAPRINDHTFTNSTIPSSPNVLEQQALSNDPNQTHILTFTFSPALAAFSMDRVGKHSGGSTDTWHADFYNAAGTLIGSVGENSPVVNAPVQRFGFTAPAGQTIARMDLVSVWTGFATHRNIPVDNFLLEPNLSPGGAWRRTCFDTSAKAGVAADDADPDHDGIVNFLEFATLGDPNASTTQPGEVVDVGGGVRKFVYYRSKAALADGIIFSVQWSDDLSPASWNSTGVTEAVLFENADYQEVWASCPPGSTGSGRFLRLRIGR